MSDLLKLSGVHTHIGRYHILQGIDLAVPQGQVTMLLGRNGAGKTTTLRTIMGLWRASSGEIRLGGERIEALGTPDIARADAILDSVALGGKRSVAATVLSHGDQRKLEVALMMALEPKVFMFDEPTAGMSVDEVPVVLGLIAKLKQDPSKIILLVEHKMDVVRSLADRIIVLHNGRLVADGNPADVIASPIVQEAYLGIAPGKSAA